MNYHSSMNMGGIRPSEMLPPNSSFYSQTPGYTFGSNNTPSSSSISLFHLPSDATNSLYVDGVPNDTTER